MSDTCPLGGLIGRVVHSIPVFLPPLLLRRVCIICRHVGGQASLLAKVSEHWPTQGVSEKPCAPVLGGLLDVNTCSVLRSAVPRCRFRQRIRTINPARPNTRKTWFRWKHAFPCLQERRWVLDDRLPFPGASTANRWIARLGGNTVERTTCAKVRPD